MMKQLPRLLLLALLGGSSMTLQANEALPFSPERLWLPPSAADVRPALEEAARRALQDPDCEEVLYGRLNSWRTEQGDPSVTILCQRDARSTFNLVYRLAELTINDDDDIPEFSTRDAESNLETLRRMLMSESEMIGTATGETGEQTDTDSEGRPSAESERGLELDLDDLLRDRNRNGERDAAPELF